MARFDVFANHGPHHQTTPFLLDVQSDHLADLSTRVVVPLRRRDSFPPVRLPKDLTPVFVIEDTECFLDTAKLAAVIARELGNPIVSLRAQQEAIIAALDRLFGAY